MSAKYYPEVEPQRCVCGEVPGISICQAGQVRLYKVTCGCGLNSLGSDDQAEAVGLWNESLQGLQPGSSSSQEAA